MNSIKCKNCGLSNFGSEQECRRCGCFLSGGGKNNRNGKRPGLLSVASLLMYVAIAAGGYYFYSAVDKSVAEVDASEARRVGTQIPHKTPQTGLTRNEAERQHANQIGKNLQSNPSFAAQRQHDAETRQAMSDASR